MAVSAVWRLFSLLAPDIGTKEHAKAHRRNALGSSHKVQKQAAFGMKPSLLALADGMGSGYGGLNQTDPVGSSGEDMVEVGLYPHPIWKYKI